MPTSSDKKRSELGAKLGRNIYERRKELGWTQAELAERISVDTETISRFERGSNLPSLTRLEMLADVLSVPLPRLIAHSSAQPHTQADVITEWITALESADRKFVMESLKQLCLHLNEQRNRTPSTQS